MEQQKYLKCLEIIEGHLETHTQIHPEERSSTDQSTNNTEDTKVGKKRVEMILIAYTLDAIFAVMLR